MKRMVFSCLALSSLAAATVIQPTAASASEAVLLSESQMDQISAGSDLSKTIKEMVKGDLSKLDAKIKELTGLLKKGHLEKAGRSRIRAIIKEAKLVRNGTITRTIKVHDEHTSATAHSSVTKSGSGIVTAATSTSVSITAH